MYYFDILNIQRREAHIILHSFCLQQCFHTYFHILSENLHRVHDSSFVKTLVGDLYKLFISIRLMKQNVTNPAHCSKTL